jgi:SAM-dependent methyltransferase
MNTQKKISYGESGHYTDAAGEAYFAYQNRQGEITGRLNAWKFQDRINTTDCVLDFGCGGGWLLKILPGKIKYGVELNSVARECCSRNGVTAVASVDLLPAGMMFDVIISHHALEHVPYPIEALRELRLRLKAGGKLIIVVPIDDWRAQRDYSGCDIDHHLHTWTPRLFANTLAEAGFSTDAAYIITDAWPPAVGRLINLPKPLFRSICYFWSILRHRRQLLAIAKPKAD